MTDRSETLRESLAREAARRVKTPCPMCGTDDWTLADDVWVMPQAGDLLIGGPPGKGVGVVAFACNGCGWVRMHSEQGLRNLLARKDDSP